MKIFYKHFFRAGATIGKSGGKDQEYAIRRGDILLFNPGDSHACVRTGSEAFDYRNIFCHTGGQSNGT